MSVQERYLKAVCRRILGGPEDREKLEADLRSHFTEGAAEGLEPARVIARLGTPDEVAASYNAERPLDFAGFWVRLVAFLADLGVMTALCLPLMAPIVFLVGFLDRTDAPIAILGLVPLAVCILAAIGVWFAYFPVAEARFGKTLGKHLLRLRVVDEEGLPISGGKALLRRLPFYFELLVLDAIFVPFTKKRQRAFDLVARTVVVYEPGRRPGAGGYLLCLVWFVGPFLALAGLLALFGILGLG